MKERLSSDAIEEELQKHVKEYEDSKKTS